MRRSVLAILLSLLVICGISTQVAFGQAVYGSILGTVTDPSGAAVAGAKVSATSQTKNTSVDTTTNESGNYGITHLIPDVYTVRVESTGFKVLEFKDISVSADSGSRVDGQFQVGSTSEQVEVTSEAPQLKTDRADVAIELNSKYVEDLPVLNRNFTTFELLSPGTQKLVGWSHAATENPQGGQQIFVNGQHFRGTAFELDGTDNQDPILGIIVVNPNLEAITETKIALQNYDAEFGKSVAGLVTVQTKSGSNDIHGSGFWFRRTDALAARDPFTQYPGGASIPHSKWQQFGGTIGGPIIKNKLFFFGDYQATRQTAGVTNQYTIPTATVLSSCNPATNGSSSTPGFCNLGDYASKIGNGTPGDPTNYLYDRTTSAATDGSGRSAFCGAALIANPTSATCPTPYLIPIGLISPQAANVLALFPQPSNSGTCAAAGSSGCINNFIASGSGPFSQNSFDTRIDYTASQSLNVFGRFSLDYFSLSGKGGLGAIGGSGFGPGGLAGSSIIHNISMAYGFTKTISSSLLTDFRFGYFKYNPEARKPDAGAPMTALGIPGMNLASGPQQAATSGLASFFFDGVLTAAGDGLNVARCNCPLNENEHQYQLVNNWTKIKGNHQYKFGTDLRFAHNLRVPSDANRTGQLNFNHQDTSNAGAGGLDLATFLLGDVTHLDRYVSTSLNAAESQKRIAFYAQDTWRLTPKLTFNYGLRYELYTPESVNGKDQGGFANIAGNGTNGGGDIRVAGEGPFATNGNIGYDPKAFAPRIGLAYEVNPKTVVRMGYGRSFDIGVFGSNFGHTVTQNLPVLANQSISASNLNLGTDNLFPVFTLTQGPPAYPFPTQFVNGQLPLGGPTNTISPHIRPTFQRLPTLDAWNVTVQRQLDNVTSLEVAYIGNKGTHVFAGDGPSYNVNQPAIGPGADVNGSFVPVTPQAQRRPFYNAFATPCADVTCIAPVVVCCSFDLGGYTGNDASSIYDAIQVKVERRFSHGLQFLSHYTYADAKHYDSNYYAISHPIAYGPDDQSRNNVWVTNVVYELPFGKGKTFMGDASRLADAIIGGWQVTNTTNWSGGLPWTPSFGECGGEEDVGVCRPDKGSGSFKMGASGLQHPAGGSPYVQFFTPVANITTTSGGPFADPGPGKLGNYGVFSLRGPRSFTSDAAASKNFTITERVKAQFRMDVFNLFNHPVLGFNGNQGGSGQCIDCSGNGRVTDIEADSSPGSTTGMRQIEFALKLSF
jgi:Carboxypeptidase regulatory-like domain/TonB dependent receptor